jgi:tetratricopeptide (TPR) repeat protein
MAQKFCTHCGAQLVPAARFCVECGEKTGGTGSPRVVRAGLNRFAPLAIVGAVVLVGGTAVWVGARSARPSNVVPSREAPPPSGQQAALPEGHPPIAVPDNVRQAIDKLAASAKANPDDLDSWRQLGFIQYRTSQADPAYLVDAKASYEHVLEKEPKDLDALRALGNIAYDQEDPEQAIRYYERFLEVEPENKSVKTDLGTMFLSARQTEKAIQIYESILKDDPSFFQAQFNLGIAYRAAGDSDRALKELQRAREVATDDVTRGRVDQLLAHLSGQPEGAAPGSAPAAAGAPGAAPAAPAGQVTGVQAEIEKIFRTHPIVGAKLDRIEWSDDRTAKVLLRQFPMDGMPPEIRKQFTDRIQSKIKESKDRNQVADTIRIELVDSASGRVMETVTE